MRSSITRWIGLPLICLAVAGGIATAATARTGARLLTATTGPTAPLATGISDPLFGQPQAPTAYAMTSTAGATYARVMVSWSGIAPTTLPASGFDPTDPTSPDYRWSALDASVSAANSAGVTPILDIVNTPSWAYNVKPAGWTGGSPQIAALGAFATALAAHYDGSGSAPVAHVFSVWNEENYTKNLYPQDPTYYRSMVNAVADGVHGVDRSDLVLAGELAPVKTRKIDRNHAIPPLSFMRTMLCISSSTPAHRTCSAPTRFDVWTHHPYSDNGPYGHSKSPDGVELGDLPKMAALVRTAWRLGAITTESGRAPQLWVTEIGWNSNPPNSQGAPMGLESRWVAESMYQIWKSGFTVGTWFQLQDRATRFQSGLYFRSSSLATASAKPLLTPFEFPFVAFLQSHGRVVLWGRDPTSNTQDVAIQQQVKRGWKTVAVIKANSYGVFRATLPLGATSAWTLRASAQGVNATGFALKVPLNENLNVTPFPLG